MLKLKIFIMKIRKALKKRIASLWLISYVIVFLIPITTSIFVSSLSLNIILEQSENLANEIIARKQDDINALWTECDRIFQNIYLSKEIEDILKKTSSDDVTAMESYRAKDYLSSLYVDTNAIEDVWVVFNNISVIASKNRYMTANDFFMIEDEKIFSKEQTEKDILKERYNGQLIKAKNTLCWLKTVSFTAKSGNYATLLIRIAPSYLAKYTSLYDNEAFFILLNKKNELIYSNKDVSPAFINNMINYPSDEQRFKFEGVKYLKYESNNLNIKHIYVVPYENILNKTKLLGYYSVISTIFSLVLGFFSIRYFLHKNLSPINEIMALIGKQSQPETNEYNHIINSIKEKNQDTQKMSNKLNAFKPLVMNNILEQLLINGSLDKNLSQQLNIEFRFNKFYLILVDLQDLGELLDSEEENSLDDAMQLSFIALSNIFSEILTPLGTALCGKIDDEIFVILNTNNADNEALCKQVEEAYALSQKYLRITARVVISEQAQSISELPVVYQEVLNRLEYATIMEETGVLLSVQESILSSGAPSNKTDVFVSQILSGDKNAALATINTVMKENILSSSHSVKYNLTNMLITAISQLSEHSNMFVCDDIIKLIMTANKLSDVNHKIEEFIVEMCKITETHPNNTDSIETRVFEYVNNNFSNPNINVKIISDTFKMTPSYLSAKFKQKYGMSVLEYINSVRVNHSMEMLVNTDLSLETIYSRCGYVSKATFLRQFKKICGVTPTTYREVRNEKK